MVDKVKPLKLESSTSGGTEDDQIPTEVDVTEDYIATKGVAFENSDSNILDVQAGVLTSSLGFAAPSVNISGLTASRLLSTDGSKNLQSEAFTADGQVLIGSSTGAFTKATLTGTANQVTVTNGAGSITLSLPQSIATSSSPTFAGLTLTGTLDSNSTLQSTSTTTGAIHTDGGLGVVKNVFFGGDLTVDVNTLHVDSANNRVGINTTSPVQYGSATIVHDALFTLANKEFGTIVTNSIGGGGAGTYGSGIGFGAAISSGGLCGIVQTQEGADTDVAGLAFIVHTSATSSAASIEAGRFDENGNFGVGTTAPSAKIHASGSGTTDVYITAGSVTNRCGATTSDGFFGTLTNHGIRFITNNTTRMEVSSGGNFVFNESGASVDFRVETNTYVNAFFIDGSADSVYVNTNSPPLAGVACDFGVLGTGTSRNNLQVYSSVSTKDKAVGYFIQASTTGVASPLAVNQADVSQGAVTYIANDRGAITTGYVFGLPIQSAASVRVNLNGTVYRIPLWADA